MTLNIAPMTDAETAALDQGTTTDDGLGALSTERGNLPLESVDAAVAITGLLARTILTQGFHNPHDAPLEATYVFPLPDRAAVVAMRMTAEGRTVDAELKERGQARAEYDRAIAQGRRASIAEEERPDIFTMRVGNILPGERVSVTLTLVGPLPYEDGEATYRLPLVVAPRYIPGTPIDGAGVGDGYAPDTDAVGDASRITPPILLPGFPNPVRLAIGVEIDQAGLTLGEVRSSLHAVLREGNRLQIQPGERVNRDFVLRLGYGQPRDITHTLELAADPSGDEGTFRLTMLPPTADAPARPRDVVLVLDRSGSMHGWKMVAARRAAARIVDTLAAGDRFAVLTFDNVVEHPPGLPDGLVEATDRNRYRAVEHLARVEARGGTELLAPLVQALDLLGDAARDRVLVLVTDGQVGNEDQILADTAKRLAGVRVHTVGIDRAVNAGFLGRLATAGGGRCELVESEDRLDTSMERIHRRIGAPMVYSLQVSAESLPIIDGSLSPHRLPDLFSGVPLVVTGRYRSTGLPDAAAGAVRVTGRTRPGEEWTAQVGGVASTEATVRPIWARAHLRDLEDRYVSTPSKELEATITETSLRFGVLCRFTAWLAVDSRIVTDGGPVHRVIQPVEPAEGWDMLVEAAAPMMLGAASPAPAMMHRAMSVNASGPAAMSSPVQAVRPGRGRSRRPRAAGVEAERDLAGPIADLREQAASEAGALRAAAGAPEYERRELLADLGTRLEAMLRGLPADADFDLVRELAALLADDRPLALEPDELDELWAQALRVLDELASLDPAARNPAARNPAGGEPTGGRRTGPSRERGQFWKR